MANSPDPAVFALECAVQYLVRLLPEEKARAFFCEMENAAANFAAAASRRPERGAFAGEYSTAITDLLSRLRAPSSIPPGRAGHTQ